MAKLPRALQKLFASTAGSNRLGKFGSLQAGTPTAYSGSTVTPANVQALSNYLSGLDGASVAADGTMPLQDLNSILWLLSYQIAYGFQAGIAEYDSTTTYFIGSLVNDGTGAVYVSKTNNNLGNALSSTANWRTAGTTPTIQQFTSGSGTYTTPAGVLYIKVKGVGGGGGGAGSGNISGGDGGTGGSTTFGSSVLTAIGGGGGLGYANGLFPGAGGTATVAGGAVGFAKSGATGQGGQETISVANVSLNGGSGGNTPFGGAGGGANGSQIGKAGAANTGGGGGGGGAPLGAGGANMASGAGGGGGGYFEAVISSPAATYAYAIGAAGTAGTLGSSGAAGGAGGTGYLYIEEYYQ